MNIFGEILTALETEERVMLATIISTSGSTPAAALSKMLVKEGGIISVGTVGGGCMEGDVLLHASRLYDANKGGILTFRLNEDDIERGLICGGSLTLLIEPVTRGQRPLYRELQSRRDEGNDSLLLTSLSPEGNVVRKYLIDPLTMGAIDEEGRIVPEGMSQIGNVVQKAYHRQETERFLSDNEETIIEPISGIPGLIIFGGGHVSKFVSRAASMAGFRVVVVDDREKYANPQRFPEASETLAVDFTEAFQRVRITASTYVVIVTRGHRFDEDVLRLALQSPAKYVGMIGSTRKVLTTYQRLVDTGIAPESLGRVYAPVGVEIGAVTPEEIAVSIVAQLIRVRRGAHLPLRDKSDVMADHPVSQHYTS